MRFASAVLCCWLLLSVAAAGQELVLPAPAIDAPPPAAVEYAAAAAVQGAYAPAATGTVYVQPSPWHAGYYHVAWGTPVALVVPPTATHQTNWGWGVGNTRIDPINPQFIGPMYAIPTGGPGVLRPTPYWPSDTLQFGVYYIRGPW